MSETRWAIYCPEKRTFEDIYGSVITFDTEGAANTNLSYFGASEKERCRVVKVTVPVEAAPAPDDSADWPWWWMQWLKNSSKDSGVGVIGSSTKTNEHGYKVDNGEISLAWLRTQHPTRPTDAEAIRLIGGACGIDLPNPDEERWWRWSSGDWEKAGIHALGIWRDPHGMWAVRVFATESTREAKRDALIAAAKAAGEPEVES